MKDTMSARDRLTLDPISKYRIYDKFPYKLLFHILIVIATTMQAIVVISVNTDYMRAQEKVFYQKLISESSKEEKDYVRQTYLYNIDQLKKHIKKTTDNMFNFEDDSLELLVYKDDDDKDIKLKNIPLYFYFTDDIEQYTPGIPKNPNWNITENNLGPFVYSENELKEFLNYVEKFEINYKFNTYVPFYYKQHLECFGWTITQIYDFSLRAHFIVNLDIKKSACADKTELTFYEIFYARFLWVHCLVIFFSICSMILSLKYLYEIIRIFWVKKNLNIYGNNEEFLSEYKKLGDLINNWEILNIIGNIFQLGSGISGIFDKENINASTEILVGFGSMFAYFGIGKYLDYSPKYSTIYKTLFFAFPNVVIFLISILPVFLGFSFLALCIFWRSERFTNVSDTMFNLFAIINGDSVYDIISDITKVSYFLGQLYGYIFCILFIVVVMNVFVSIINEAYISSKMLDQGHWIYTYMKNDPTFLKDDNDDLPNIKAMTSKEVKEELNKRISKLEEGIEKCNKCIEDVNEIQDKNEREKLKDILIEKINKIEKNILILRQIWEEREY